MKILLFQEFSGLFNNLESGLRQLGHEVYLVSDGDGFKNYPSDFRWDVKCKFKPLAKFLSYIKLIANYRKLKGYDVSLVVTTSISRYMFFNRIVYYHLIRKNSKKMYLVGSGLYATSWKYWSERNDTKYYNYAQNDGWKNMAPVLFNKLLVWEKELYGFIDGIIPIWYEYAQPYRDLGYKKLFPAIRIPIDIAKFVYKPNIVSDKIVFFHGISRPCKGGVYILGAFDKLREKYKNEAEFIAAGNLPFDEYMKIIDRANVIIDDANSYSFAMNVLFSMAKGKICVGGAEPESNKELGYAYNPVVNICADINQIAEALEDIIKNKSRIEEWGKESRAFVEEYHNYVEVAMNYEKFFISQLAK